MPNSMSAQVIQVLAGHDNNASILGNVCLPVPLHNHVESGASNEQRRRRCRRCDSQVEDIIRPNGLSYTGMPHATTDTGLNTIGSRQ
jgi:hypothetical protein